MSKIRVLLVDDHALLREGLRALLERYPDFEVVGEAENGEEAIAQVKAQQPDIVLMDIAMPGINGLDATRAIRQDYPQTRVLVLTQHEDRQYVMSLLKAGASGYVLKRALGKDLVNALRTVASGESFMYPTVASTVLELLQRTGTPQDRAFSLTPREKEILTHIVHGATNPQIASKLSLSVKTVDWHRVNLMNKLGVHSVADLVRYALQNGLAD